MADTTLPGVLLKGVAASRPAASAVASGTIYSATDTGAITQSDGVSTWSAFAAAATSSTAPQFTTIELGHATDTTIARASAGNLTVEGNALYRAGGTDVAIADGGTGAGTATAGFDALSPMTTAGDLILGGASGTRTRLAIGSNTHVLTSNGTTAAWAAAGAASAEFVTGNTKIATSETTTSAIFADLATPGPSVTVTVGTSGIVLLLMACRASNDGDNDNYIGIVISGASTVAAATKMVFHPATAKLLQVGSHTVITGLAAGSTTFKMQYAVAAGTGTFLLRELTVLPVF